MKEEDLQRHLLTKSDGGDQSSLPWQEKHLVPVIVPTLCKHFL